ncbi:MAG: hypothetical protein ACYS19_11045 [Planctomycetota bacterium]|jgi:hypothetical protein
MAALAFFSTAGRSLLAAQKGNTERRNIVLVLSDDHRYDFMGFMKEAPTFLETPNMERMAQQQRVRQHLTVLAEPGVDPHRTVHAQPSHR